MPHLDRDGVRLYYAVRGSARGGRHPLFLTHGYSASASMWALNLPALSAPRQVITWDIRGHGRSDAPSDPALYSAALSVEDMAALLDRAGVGKVILGGLSLGGYLSLAFYRRYPGRVMALVLCDTGPGYRRDEPRAEWNAIAIRRAEEFERRGFDALGDGPEVRASGHRSPEGLALAARGILTQHDSGVIDSLESITVPTLVLVGAEDKPFRNSADMMAAKIPGATKVVLEGAGHAANLDQPEAFDRALLDFLGDL